MQAALSTYGFLSAKLKARTSKTLPPEAIESLIRARSLPEAVQFLRGTAYAPVEEAYSATGDLRAGEALLNARELELYTGLFRYLSEPVLGFIKALSLRFEIDKVKNAIRLWFDAQVRVRSVEGRSGYLYRGTIVHAFDVDTVIQAPDTESLAQAFAGTPYQALVRRELQGKVSSIFHFELALDRFYYEEAFAAASRLGKADRAVAERILGVDVDMQNVSWLVRFKSFYGMGTEEAVSRLIPRGRAISTAAMSEAFGGDRSGSGSGGALGLELLRKSYGSLGALLGGSGDATARLAMMESALRQVSIAEADRNMAGFPFSIGVVLAYFTRQREEMRTVMTILNAKNYSLPEERIRSSL